MARKQKGITLIALVITIIVLLILAGISIATLTGENGLIGKAKETKSASTVAGEKEKIGLAVTATESNAIIGKSNDYLKELQKELDELEGEGNTEVTYGDYYDYSAGWDTLKILFKNTENTYYIIYYWTDDSTSIDISTENEIYDKIYGMNIELITDETEKAELNDNYLVNGVKMTIAIGDNGIYGVNLASNAIVDWGDGTYGKIKSTETGSTTEVENYTYFTHNYSETNREYEIRVYSTYIYEEGGRIKEIKDWGECGLESVQILSEYFYWNSELTQIASPRENSFINLTEISFMGSKQLTTIPADLFKNVPKLENLHLAFMSTGITSIPEGFLDNCTNVSDFKGTFAYCENLVSIPNNLFEKCTNVTSFFGTFANCSNLEQIGETLWTRGTNTARNSYKGDPDGKGCFGGCTKITNYSEIPSYWKTSLYETSLMYK